MSYETEGARSPHHAHADNENQTVGRFGVHAARAPMRSSFDALRQHLPSAGQDQQMTPLQNDEISDTSDAPIKTVVVPLDRLATGGTGPPRCMSGGMVIA